MDRVAPKKTRAGSRISVCMRLDPDDVEALRAEAARRARLSLADRVDHSCLVREAIQAAPWYRPPEDSDE